MVLVQLVKYLGYLLLVRMHQLSGVLISPTQWERLNSSQINSCLLAIDPGKVNRFNGYIDICTWFTGLVACPSSIWHIFPKWQFLQLHTRRLLIVSSNNESNDSGSVLYTIWLNTIIFQPLLKKSVVTGGFSAIFDSTWKDRSAIHGPTRQSKKNGPALR